MKIKNLTVNKKMTIWFTGIPSAGKVIAKGTKYLNDIDIPNIILDGDDKTNNC